MVEDAFNLKKMCAVCLIALFIGFIAYISAINAQTTADNNANITNVFEIVVNNTDLAPAMGTGERVAGTIYYANNSPIELMVLAHANVVGDTATVEVFINGTMVQNQSGRPLGGAEQTYRSVAVIVPKFANYTAHFHNVHHYEWREYPILSGRNGTLSVNQTFITNITNTFNATYDQTTKEFNSNYTAQTFPNSSITILISNVSSLQSNDTKSRFSAYNSSLFTYSMGNCVIKYIVMDVVDFDTFSDYNTKTGNYTVNISGYYIINANVGFSPPSVPIGYDTFIYKNGAQIAQFDTALNYTGFGSEGVGGQKLVLLSKGDNISVAARACPDTGTNGGTIIGRSIDTWLNIIGI